MTRRAPVLLASLLIFLTVGQKDLFAQEFGFILPANVTKDFTIHENGKTCIQNSSSHDAQISVILSRSSNIKDDYLIRAHGNTCFTWGREATVRVYNRSQVDVSVENTYPCSRQCDNYGRCRELC
jgi:hypothetical protein